MQFITHASKDKNKILKKQGNNTEINVFSFLMVFSLRENCIYLNFNRFGVNSSCSLGGRSFELT